MNKEMKLTPELRFPEFNDEEDWDEKVLSDVCEITNGKANAQDHTEDGLYPLFDRSEVIKATNNYIFDCEAVIIPGEGMRFMPKYYEGKFNLHQRAYALKDFSCNGQFVYHSMLHRSNLISRKAVQSTVLSLRLPILQHFPIEIPRNPEEQQKIASCLSSLDELLAAHKDKLDALKDHKKGLLQNLFPQEGETVPKVRFPEFEDDGDWVEKTFEELFTIGSGKDYKHLSEGEIPVYGSGGYMLSVDDFLHDGESVCIGRKGTIDNPIFLTGKFWTVDTLFYTYQFVDCLPKFIYYIFLGINWQNHNEAGGVPSLSKKNLYQITTAVPTTIEEQKKIASCLSAVDALITAQQEKIDELQQHKKGLMQGLFPKIAD